MTTTLYGSVGGKTKTVQKLYGSKSVTKEIYLTSYIEDVDTDTFYASYTSYLPNDVPWSVFYDYPIIEVWVTSSGLEMHFKSEGGAYYTRWLVYNKSYFGAITGVTCVDGQNMTTLAYYLEGLGTGSKTPLFKAGFPPSTKEIKKLYASVNGVTKLVYSK